MIRLDAKSLATLTAGVEVPGYDRSLLKPGVVHLGIGAFHRAHQAVLFDDAARRGDFRFGVRGVSLRSPNVADRLNPQDGLYGIVVEDGDETRLRIIGSVLEVLVAPRDPGAVIAAIADPDTRLVTLTATEKGYKLDPATGRLLFADPDITADILSLAAPKTAPGFIVAGLAARRAKGLGPLTIMSCDNLPHNGKLLRAAVLGLAAQHDEELVSWISRTCAFPQTMVDRIVPATTAADIGALATRLGVEDRGMVKTEPFSQWVIEDRFATEVPDFAALGATVTKDVGPYETAKLRMLNGAHSGIAYLGGLKGVEFVHEFIDCADGARFVERLWDETATTFELPPDFEIAAYRAALMARFANPALRHRTRQIAMDGSQKLPQRLVAPILVRRAAGQNAEALSLAVAAWMRWQRGRDDNGESFTVDDPLAARTAAALSNAADPETEVRALLAIDDIFPPEPGIDDALVTTLARHLAALENAGVASTLRSLP